MNRFLISKIFNKKYSSVTLKKQNIIIIIIKIDEKTNFQYNNHSNGFILKMMYKAHAKNIKNTLPFKYFCINI